METYPLRPPPRWVIVQVASPMTNSKRMRVTRPHEEAAVFAEDGTKGLGKPTRTLYDLAKRTMGTVWARPSETTEGLWCSYPEHIDPSHDPDARRVRVL